ncbi:unnamed protein product [Allacma fusca]|uniref:Uncharacterized protein n=1 Tax=Allacma fusca TaxID=39272 RepID=A0A8J2LGF2_9HEXA|nr:unnamed protein product [Allacma fusca]
MELKIYSLLILLGVCSVALAQKRSIPNTISSCYLNSTAYNRYTRQPMQIENLIAIVRKIEEKTFNDWTPRQISRTILKQFQFDGLTYDPNKKQVFRYETSANEDHRMDIIYSILPGEWTIPDGTLDNDERCALHWMLSHSLNTTLRDDEERDLLQNKGYLKVKREIRSQRSISNDSDSDIEKDEDLPDYSNSKTLNDTSSGNPTTSKSANSTDQLSLDPTKQTSQLGGTSHDKDVLKDGRIENLPMDVEFPKDKKQDDSTRQKYTNVPVSKNPVETGVIHTKWGAIAGAQLIGGIAAGLEPLSKPVVIITESDFSGGQPTGGGSSNNGNRNSGGFRGGQGSNKNREPMYPSSGDSPGILTAGRKKRQSDGGNYLQPLLNYHATTLAGDVGQAAILNGVFARSPSVSPPRGTFNDSICPREYVLESLSNPDHDVSNAKESWTYMTVAEIRGGIDGLVLGAQVKQWDDKYGYKLSELLEMYYSEKGIVGQPSYRACKRGDVFSRTFDSNVILDQAKSFAYIYNNKTSTITSAKIDELYRAVGDAYNKMLELAKSLSSIDPPCELAESSTNEIPDDQKLPEAPTTLYVVADPSDTTDMELVQQKRFIAQLAYELEVRPHGSRLGLINGADGTIRIKPNFTDNAAILACRILDENLRNQAQQDPVKALTTLQIELDRIRVEELQDNYQDQNGITILFLNQGKKLEANLRDDVRGKLNEFESTNGDVHIMYATSKYQVGDYDDFVDDREYDVIRIQSSPNLSTEAGRFVKEYVKRNHGRITYTRCNKDRYPQDGEEKIGTDLFVSSNKIHYFKISPDYFYSSRNLRLRFSSYNGKVRICYSRSNRYPNSLNSNEKNVDCEETKGQYKLPGTGEDVEIAFSKPCGGDGTRNGCDPIYLSITPISGVSESDRLDCRTDKCQYSDQVKVTFSHWDMRCNTAVHTLVSLPGLFITLLMSVVTFCKYS